LATRGLLAFVKQSFEGSALGSRYNFSLTIGLKRAGERVRLNEKMVVYASEMRNKETRDL
jgi:hypothetical protein